MLKIKEIRENKNLTQDELSAISGIKKRSLVDYENEKQDIPLGKLQIIATALNVNIIELLGVEIEKINNNSEVTSLKKEIETLKETNDLLRFKVVTLEKELAQDKSSTREVLASSMAREPKELEKK